MVDLYGKLPARSAVSTQEFLMLRLAALMLPLLAPLAGQAQTVSYCAGSVVADLFDTRVTAGQIRRATYSVVLRNTQSVPQRVQVNVTASILDRPTGSPRTLNAGQRVTVQLGYQILSGNAALRGEALANATRVSCV